MLERVKKYAELNRMFEKGETVVIGVSGGADSVCLLACMEELKKEYNLTLIAVHVNHGIRGDEADRDQRFVQDLCREHGVPCRVFAENIPEYAGRNGLSEEEAGRKIRYERFAQVCRENGSLKIAVAHNANDQTETILFNMLRGSSVGGIRGMKPVSSVVGITWNQPEDTFSDGFEDRGENFISGNEIILVRPLLETERSEIEEYLNVRGITWCNDSTNGEEAYSRNYIRKTLVPAMEKLSPKAAEHIRTLGKDAGEIEEYIDFQVEKYYNQACVDNRLSIEICMNAPEIIRKKLVYRFICENAGYKKDIQRVHVLNIVKLLQNEVGKSVDLPYDITVRRDYSYLVAVKRGEKNEKSELNRGPVEISVAEGGSYDLGNGKKLTVRTFPYDKNVAFPKEKSKVWFDADKIGQKLVLRAPEEGDYFCPYTDGRKKKLNRLFIEEKVSREVRQDMLVVASENRCLWIPGLRRDEALRLDRDSVRVLELTLEQSDSKFE